MSDQDVVGGHGATPIQGGRAARGAEEEAVMHRGTAAAGREAVPLLATLSTTGGMAIAQIAVAVGYAIAARAAGPDQFGQSLSAIAIGAVAGGLLDFGLAALQTRELASGRTSTSAVLTLLVDRVLLASLVAALAIGATLLFASDALPLVAGAAAVMLGSLCTLLGQVVLRATGRAHVIALATVIDKVVFGAVIVLLLLAGAEGSAAVVVGVVAGLVVDAVLCVFVTGGARSASVARVMRSTSPARWIGGWRGVGGYGLAGVVGALQQIDLPLMTLSGGPAAAGAYGAVGRWTTPLLLPSSAIAQVGIAHAAAAPTMRRALLSLRRVAWILAAAALASVAVACLAEPITDVILGPAYRDSSAALRLLALATIPTLLAQPLVMVVESRGRERSVAFVLLLSLVGRLGCALVLTPMLGGTAGAVGVLVQQAMTCLLVAVLAAHLLDSEGRTAHDDHGPADRHGAAARHVAAHDHRPPAAPRGVPSRDRFLGRGRSEQ